MEESHVHDIARVIQMALAPAFLLSGIAALLNVFANRLARIVDRTRVLEARATAAPGDAEELGTLRRRGELVRGAITMGTGAALLVSLVIGVAFVGFLARMNFAMIVAGLFVAAMGALTLALGFFLREVVLAVGSLETFLPRAVVRTLHRHDDDDEGPSSPS